ncbi:2647_t:CDS:2 [Acaulospora colombiana]|uniref:2647_t:CDS:1 n=1 Tax=Acaulospora colombiana TaxID=27376 RepID=A0ACA9M994_9GLOM|nr:2647_t:CDS:2 [Acaulospora colombiana]
MSSRAIQVWFQNRRAKVKRDAQESKNAAKMNKPKKLTLAAGYCQEKRITDFDSIRSTSPTSSVPSYTNSPTDSKSKADLSTQIMVRPNTQSLANISFALTSSTKNHRGENVQSTYYPQTISSSNNNNMNNDNSGECDSATGLLQQEGYWNAHASWNGDRSTCPTAFFDPESGSLTNDQRFGTSPALEISPLSEQIFDPFYQSSSGPYYWPNGRQEILTSPAGLGVEISTGPNSTPIQSSASSSKFENLSSTISTPPLTSVFPTNFTTPIWATSFVTNINQTEDSNESRIQPISPSIESSSLHISVESSDSQNYSHEDSFLPSTGDIHVKETITAKNTHNSQSPYSSGFDREKPPSVEDDGEIDVWEDLYQQ